MDGMEILKGVRALLSKELEELVEFAKGSVSHAKVETNAEGYAYCLGYTRGSLHLAIESLERTAVAKVGQEIKVPWSNGAGYTIYKVVDDPGNGPHQFTVVEERETGG
jgi:hypothetical protein